MSEMNESATPRPRGRPKGSLNKAPKFRNYKPKRWKPYFDEIVLLSAAAGLSNTELATKYKISPQHVSNILNTDEAEEIRKRLRSNLKEASKLTIEERMAKLQNKALQRVEEYIDSDHIFDKDPTNAVDRAFKLLGGLKGIVNPDEKKAGDTVINNNTLIVNNTQFNQLMEGAAKAADVEVFTPQKQIAK